MTRRLILFCVLLCVAEGLIVGWLVHRDTQRSFEDFVRQGAIRSFRSTAVAYFESHGSWDGFGEYLARDREARGPFPPPPPGGHARSGAPAGFDRVPPDGSRFRNAGTPPRYGLADPSGRVVLSDGVHREGILLDSRERASAVPLEVRGVERARILVPPASIVAGSPERRFLDGTDRALLLAIALAVALAIMVGSWLAAAYTRPLRALTGAASRLAHGRLGEQVPLAPAQAELGDLTAAFNKMSEELARADAQRRQLTADVAHELRSPITVLTGYLEAMEQGDLSPTPERIRSMRAAAVGLGRLVEELRTLSLAEAGGISLQRSRVAPGELLSAVGAAFQTEAAARGVEFEVDADATLPLLEVDRERMAQVLSNLASNALRFTPSGGRITLQAPRESDGAVLIVRDTGSGIAPSDLPRVFDRFYRADRSRHESEHSGLGLAIARSLVELHGGSIEVESELGRGTCFTVRLPAQSGAANR